MKKSKSILVCASTGFIIRNLLLGKFIGCLPNHIKIIAAVPNPNDPILIEKLGPRVKLIPFAMLPEPDVSKMSRLRRVFNLPHVMFRTVEGYKTNSSMDIQAKILEGLNTKWYLFSVYILNKFGKLLFLFGCFSYLERFFYLLIRRSEAYHNWISILREHKPDMLVSTMLSLVEIYRYSLDLPAVLASQKLQIKTGCIIQSWDNVTTKPAILPKFVYKYWTWSAYMNQELLKYNPQLKANQLEIVGGLQFDYHTKELVIDRQEFVHSLGLNPAKPYILFTPGTRKLIRFEDEQCVNIIKFCMEKKLDAQYVIRLHPKDYGYRWEKHKDFLKENNIYLQKTALDVPMDKGGVSSPTEFYKNQINTIYHGAVLINTASTTAVDAAFLNKPIINLSWDVKDDGLFKGGRAKAYLTSEHYKPIVESGGIQLVNNDEECYEAILNYLQNPEYLSEGRKKIVDLVTVKADGKAGDRLAAGVLKAEE